MASATGAANQASSVVGSAVAQLVMGRLGINSATAQAVPALQAAPADVQRRSELAAALRDVLIEDPAFAAALGEAVQAVDRNVHVVASGQDSLVQVDSPVTASGRGVAVGRDQHNLTRVTKKNGTLWIAALVAVVVVSGGTTLLVTQDSPNESPRKKAEKVAVDWARAGYVGDIETMCGLTTGRDSHISGCRTDEETRRAKAAVASDPPSDDEIAAAEGWKAESSELPSDNTARVTVVNTKNRSGVKKDHIVVHLTRQGSDWLVSDAKGISSGDSEG
ncbi:hypothetical protein [Kitasatospora sp. A2-31]|uniref:hypothetical protein n=1 Tax=Kitasatospora sp. A2-31 TaxID=2916414 RepID=UPI001EED7AAB|nr:hypothetical protein [Kitasatospora sp. A2-31]MCG6498849.1 hypothetical protein [Kitasatospora sp. A2-31]